MIDSGKNYLLFDGDCGICTYLSDRAAEMDRGSRFVIEPFQIFPEYELKKFGITYERCTKELQVITGRGRVYGGAFGVNYFLWHQYPWSLLVIMVYAIPLLLVLEIIVYRLIATNRHRISQWLGMKACLLKR